MCYNHENEPPAIGGLETMNAEEQTSINNDLTGRVFHSAGVPKECPVANKQSVDDIHWYVLRVTYSRELALKDYLDLRGIESFIPMRYEIVVRGERKFRKLVPAIHNLVFVRSTREQLDEIKRVKALTLPIRYFMDRETRRPLTIPERQMQSFIAVAGNYDEQIVYLDATTVALKKGDRVRITDGIFKGVEGEFVRVKGDRRVMVAVQGVMAVATAFVHPSLIEVIE